MPQADKQICDLVKYSCAGTVAHSFNPLTLDTEEAEFCELEASLHHTEFQDSWSYRIENLSQNTMSQLSPKALFMCT